MSFSNKKALGVNVSLRVLPRFYESLFQAFGPQKWWPALTPLEVIVGAILTQNTAWTNVEKAMKRLREAGALNWPRLRDISNGDLADLIRPAGTFNVKVKRLKAFVEFLFDKYGGDLAATKTVATPVLREQLLEIHGVGPETADAILLYALQRPVFVVDAYTKRFMRRHGLIRENATYDEVKTAFESTLSADVTMFNEYHALIVELGKRYCRPKPRCEACPLNWHPHVT